MLHTEKICFFNIEREGPGYILYYNRTKHLLHGCVYYELGYFTVVLYTYALSHVCDSPYHVVTVNNNLYGKNT